MYLFIYIYICTNYCFSLFPAASFIRNKGYMICFYDIVWVKITIISIVGNFLYEKIVKAAGLSLQVKLMIL